jgi:hypothetical protein
MKRPITMIGAVALNGLIGVTMLFAGVLLVGAFLDGMHERVGISPSLAIPTRVIIFGMPIYGALAVIGAIATWRRSARGWWLALAVDLVGIASLVWVVSLDGPDSVNAGFVIWGLAVVLLVLPPTRAALRN